MPTYTIKEKVICYSKKKGAYSKTRILHRNLDQTAYNELMAKPEFKKLKFSIAPDNPRKLVAITPGMLFPGEMIIIKSKE